MITFRKFEGQAVGTTSNGARVTSVAHAVDTNQAVTMIERGQIGMQKESLFDPRERSKDVCAIRLNEYVIGHHIIIAASRRWLPLQLRIIITGIAGEVSTMLIRGKALAN